MRKIGEDYMLSYLNALKFWCHPLAELINSEKKEIVSEIETIPGHEQLSIIQDAFYQLSGAFLFWQRQVNSDTLYLHFFVQWL